MFFCTLSISARVRRMARKPCAPNMSCTSSASKNNPSNPRPYCCQNPCGSVFFFIVLPLQNPLGGVANLPRGGGCALRFDVESQQWFRTAESHQHPRPVFEHKFCAVRAVDRRHFSSEQLGSTRCSFLDSRTLLLVAQVQIFPHRPESPPACFE